MTKKEKFKAKFKGLINKLYKNTRDVDTWTEIAFLFDEIYDNEERDIRVSELLIDDFKKIIPKDTIIWKKILTIDKRNITALEKIIEFYADIHGDIDKAIIYINQLDKIVKDNLVALRFKIIYHLEHEQIEKAKKIFINMINLDVNNCLYYGVFDYFYEEDMKLMKFLKPYATKTIKCIDEKKNGFRYAYYKTLKSELLELIK